MSRLMQKAWQSAGVASEVEVRMKTNKETQDIARKVDNGERTSCRRLLSCILRTFHTNHLQHFARETTKIDHDPPCQTPPATALLESTSVLLTQHSSIRMALLLKIKNLATLETAANSRLSRRAKTKAVALSMWNQLQCLRNWDTSISSP
jgi:hypothetical protein